MEKVIGFENEFNSILKNLSNNLLNNSILISGNKGIGKRYFLNSIIREFLKIKFKDDIISHHLSLLNNNTHPNIKILEKKIDEKTKKIKNYITIDQIRELYKYCNETSIIENLQKFIIIDSADTLNSSSSNGLLKILEEPINRKS